MQNEFREFSACTVITVLKAKMHVNTVNTLPAKISWGPFRKSYTEIRFAKPPYWVNTLKPNGLHTGCWCPFQSMVDGVPGASGRHVLSHVEVVLRPGPERAPILLRQTEERSAPARLSRPGVAPLQHAQVLSLNGCPSSLIYWEKKASFRPSSSFLILDQAWHLNNPWQKNVDITPTNKKMDPFGWSVGEIHNICES